jgi:hypothetical protein
MKDSTYILKLEIPVLYYMRITFNTLAFDFLAEILLYQVGTVQHCAPLPDRSGVRKYPWFHSGFDPSPGSRYPLAYVQCLVIPVYL